MMKKFNSPILQTYPVKPLTCCAICVLSGYLFLPPYAHAFEYTVNNESDLFSAWSTPGVDRVTFSPNLNILLSAPLGSPQGILFLDGQGGSIDGAGNAIIHVDVNANNPQGQFSGLQNITLKNGLAAAPGGALYVKGDLTSGISSSQILGNKSTEWGVGGGAVAVEGNFSGGINGSLFNDNQGAGNFGGALFVKGRFSGGIHNTTFSNNRLRRDLPGGSTTSHFGAAVGIRGIFDGGIHNSSFTHNTTTHIGPESTGHAGGAFYAYELNGGIHDSLFANNQADDYGGAIEIGYLGGTTGNIRGGIYRSQFLANSTNRQGGAIRTPGMEGIVGGIHDSLFQDNTSGMDGGAYFSRVMSGGIYNSNFIHNTATRYGGAIALIGGTGATAYLDGGIHHSVFDGNRVEGTSTGYTEGLGGAMLLGGDLDINGSTFVNNVADTAHMGDNTSGRGGAIFFNARELNQSVNLIAADAGSSVHFSGNVHNPGGSGQTANSIYFGSTTLASVLPQSGVNLSLNTASGATIEMFDPMMSQEDGLLDAGGNPYTVLEVNVDKTGPGRWLLGGLNDMRSAGDWRISQGALFLSGQSSPARGTSLPVHINLSHANSSFTLNRGACLEMTLEGQPHQISAQNIRLESGSTSAVTAMYGEPFVVWPTFTNDPIAVLSLDAKGGLDNQQDQQQTDGILRIGVDDYAYQLYWDPNSKDTLYLQILNSVGHSDERAGTSSVTAPGVMVYHNNLSKEVIQRSNRQFLQTPDLELNNTFWVTPVYGHTQQDSGGSRAGYKLTSAGLALGADRWVSSQVFLGIAANFSKPHYTSDDADIHSKDYTFLLYSGVALPYQFDATFFMGYGQIDLEQTRRVHGVSYQTDYDANHYHFGFDISRPFQIRESVAVRPFVSYEYLRLKVDGYNEGDGPYALNVRGYTQNLHQTRIGSALEWQKADVGRFDAQAYYARVFGDLNGETAISFTQSPSVNYQTRGNMLDRHVFGLSLGGTLTPSKNTELSLRYGFEKGRHTEDQQLSLNISYRW